MKAGLTVTCFVTPQSLAPDTEPAQFAFECRPGMSSEVAESLTLTLTWISPQSPLAPDSTLGGPALRHGAQLVMTD